MSCSDDNIDCLADHITASRGSGEHALRHLLGPYAWARAPLEDDLKDIKVRVRAVAAYGV